MRARYARTSGTSGFSAHLGERDTDRSRQFVLGPRRILRGRAPAASSARSTSAVPVTRRSTSPAAMPTFTRCGVSRSTRLRDDRESAGFRGALSAQRKLSLSTRPIPRAHRGRSLAARERMPRNDSRDPRKWDVGPANGAPAERRLRSACWLGGAGRAVLDNAMDGVAAATARAVYRPRWWARQSRSRIVARPLRRGGVYFPDRGFDPLRDAIDYGHELIHSFTVKSDSASRTPPRQVADSHSTAR